MVWNILFFLLGVFGGVTLMSIMWVYDICKEDDFDIELRKKYDELFGLKEGEVITYKDAVTIMENNEDIDKHIPRVD